MTIAIRKATLSETATITRLVEESARGLGATFYRREIIEAALGSIWGVDTQLIADGTYYLLSVGDELAACGGWSFRSKLFGADALSSPRSTRLRPGQDAARIRAFFVRPAFARRGLGSRLLRHCEQEAAAGGFRSWCLGATEPGRHLYRTHGYVEGTPVNCDLGEGMTMVIFPMAKSAGYP